MSIFDTLRNAFQPIYDDNSSTSPSWCRYIGSIPRSLLVLDEARGELRTCDGVLVKRHTVSWDIREDGPGAWGCGLILYTNDLFRWPKEREEDGWYLVTEKHYITIESAGGALEVISHHEDKATWVLNTFDEI